MPCLQREQDLEEVEIETVHVGDYVYAENGPRCVLSKATTRQENDRVTGWRVELMSASPMWLPRRAKVLRKRFGIVRASAAPKHTVRLRTA